MASSWCSSLGVCEWLRWIKKNRWEKEERNERNVRETVEIKSLEQGKSCAKNENVISWRYKSAFKWTKPPIVYVSLNRLEWDRWRDLVGENPGREFSASNALKEESSLASLSVYLDCIQQQSRKQTYTHVHKRHIASQSLSLSHFLFRCKIPFYKVRAKLGLSSTKTGKFTFQVTDAT